MEASMWGKLIAVFIGSGLGGMCRWAVSQVPCTSWPAGTLIANVGGCFLLGWLSRMAPGSEMVRMLLMTGFCGGFTTFSTFSADTVRLLRAGCYNAAAVYVALSVAVCIVFAALGMWIGTTFRN